jgi:spermidine/putrescine transport system permease protein
MWSQLRFPQKLPSVLALGSVILVVSFVVVFLSQWLRGRGVAKNPTLGAEP